MKKLILSLVLALSPLGLFAASGTAIAGGNQAASFVINKSGAYYLSGNRVMTATGKAAIEITASDVTLDLNGFTLGYADINGTGDAIVSKGSNLEVRNGSITAAPGHAINAPWALGTIGLRIIDVRISDTGGIFVGTEDAWIERCQIFDSRGYAIKAQATGTTIKDCVVKNVLASATDPGFGISTENLARVIGCHLAEVTSSAILVQGLYSTIQDNRVQFANLSGSAVGAGIRLDGGRGSRVIGNSVNQCHVAGIRFENNSPECAVENNFVNRTATGAGQTGYGIVTSNAIATVLCNNRGSANSTGFILGGHLDGGGNVTY